MSRYCPTIFQEGQRKERRVWNRIRNVKPVLTFMCYTSHPPLILTILRWPSHSGVTMPLAGRNSHIQYDVLRRIYYAYLSSYVSLCIVRLAITIYIYIYVYTQLNNLMVHLCAQFPLVENMTALCFTYIKSMIRTVTLFMIINII
jgi:hypothetical protein